MNDLPQKNPLRRALLGLLGAPIKSSASPHMHERAGDAVGIRCHYQLIEIANADRAELERLLYGVRRLGFSGINVTFPYKEAVIDLLDELSPGVRAIGAVNTIVVRDGRLTGHNTDSSGFKRAIAPYVRARPGPVALIGAGGVGKAIAFALSELDVMEIRVFDTDPTKMRAIAAIIGNVPLTICASVAEAMTGAAGLVNATPIGMAPNLGSPVPEHLLRAHLFVSDAVYSPLWTPLLLAAKKNGAKAMTGRDLAIFQAADAFELFTRTAAPVDIIGAAFDEIMQSREQAA